MAAGDAPQQILGRALTIGCVALEITQRCNLDCTLCYLSENSEHVVDIPLEEVLRRLDNIRDTYGPYTMCKSRAAIQRYVNTTSWSKSSALRTALNFSPALFTNGIGGVAALVGRLSRGWA